MNATYFRSNCANERPCSLKIVFRNLHLKINRISLTVLNFQTILLRLTTRMRMGGGLNHAYSRLSTTHGHITDCKLDSVVYAGVMRGDLMGTCLVWAERSTPDNFGVPSHRFNSATRGQKGITQTAQTIYTDSEPPSRMPNSLMPSAKLKSANLLFFTSLVWHGRASNPGLQHPEGTL